MDSVVALDVGGTVMKGGLMDSSNELVQEQRFDTRRETGPAAVVERIGEVIETLIAQAANRPVAIGVAVPGLVNEQEGVALRAANLGWFRVPLVKLLTERFDLPVMLGHDVRTGAWAEWRAGAARGSDSFLYVSIGTGVGGAYLLNGEMLLGATHGAMEIGHLRVRADGGVLCRCGGRGCLESIASAAAIARTYAALAGSESASATEVAQLARAGDAIAAQAWGEAVEALADGLMATITLLDPELIVFGGGLSEAGEQLLDPLTSAVSRRLSLERLPVLRKAMFGDRAGCVGAGLLAWERVTERTPS